jgi:hypothetical protein
MKDGTLLTVGAVATLAAAGIIKGRRAGSFALSDYGVEIYHNAAEGTVAKGNTRPIKELLKQRRFRWYRTGGFWYIPRSRGLAESPIDLAALRSEAESILSGESEPPNVVPFRRRGKTATAPPRPVMGHSGDVAFLGPDGTSFSLSDIYASTGIRFGTSAPYAVGYVGPDRIGFGDYPMIVVEMYGKAVNDLVPIARQLAMLNAKINGLYINMGPPSVGMAGRERVMVDQNPSSPSVGKRKRLKSLKFTFEISGTSQEIPLSKWVRSRYYSGRPGSFDYSETARKLTREEMIKSRMVAE